MRETFIECKFAIQYIHVEVRVSPLTTVAQALYYVMEAELSQSHFCVGL